MCRMCLGVFTDVQPESRRIDTCVNKKSSLTGISCRKFFSTTRFFQLRQAAAYAGVHFSAIETVVRQGLLPARRLGRNIIIRKSDLDKFLASLELVYPQKRGAA